MERGTDAGNVMRWTPRGAHLRLQIRVQALNGDLHGVIERWYPGLGHKIRSRLRRSTPPTFGCSPSIRTTL
jgi:hypothetical protein